MRAAGALPSEDRVKKMTDIQYIWYYRNLLKDNEENETLMKERIDYLSLFINPDMYRSVMNLKDGDNVTSPQLPVKTGDVYVNNSFEEELKAALGEGETLTELPNSSVAGDVNMSKDDFLQLAMQMQAMSDQEATNNSVNAENQTNNIENDIDNLDYFEIDED